MNSVPSFLDSLWTILNTYDYQDTISWGKDIKDPSNFVLKDLAKFRQIVLPAFYKHNNLNSFYRNLNLYGFTRIKKGDTIVISHKCLDRNDYKSLSKIKRVRGKAALNTYDESSSQNVSGELYEGKAINFPGSEKHLKHDLRHFVNSLPSEVFRNSSEGLFIEKLAKEEISDLSKELKKTQLDNAFLRKEVDTLRHELHSLGEKFYYIMSFLGNNFNPNSGQDSLNRSVYSYSVPDSYPFRGVMEKKDLVPTDHLTYKKSLTPDFLDLDSQDSKESVFPIKGKESAQRKLETEQKGKLLEIVNKATVDNRQLDSSHKESFKTGLGENGMRDTLESLLSIKKPKGSFKEESLDWELDFDDSYNKEDGPTGKNKSSSIKNLTTQGDSWKGLINSDDNNSNIYTEQKNTGNNSFSDTFRSEMECVENVDGLRLSTSANENAYLKNKENLKEPYVKSHQPRAYEDKIKYRTAVNRPKQNHTKKDPI